MVAESDKIPPENAFFPDFLMLLLTILTTTNKIFLQMNYNSDHSAHL